MPSTTENLEISVSPEAHHLSHLNDGESIFIPKVAPEAAIPAVFSLATDGSPRITRLGGRGMHVLLTLEGLGLIWAPVSDVVHAESCPSCTSHWRYIATTEPTVIEVADYDSEIGPARILRFVQPQQH